MNTTTNAISARTANHPDIDRTLRHSVGDGVAHAVMQGTGETYLLAYALFLGATAAQLSLLVALPPLFGALAQLVAARLERRTAHRRSLIFTAVLLQAAAWLPIVWLPYGFPAYAVPLLAASLTLYQGCAGFTAPLWSSLMGALVPAHRRGRYFGLRARRATLAAFFGTVAAGLTLQHFEARDNAQLAFVLIFAAAALARLCSAYHIGRMHEPPAAHSPADTESRPADTRLLRFSAFTAVFACAVSVAGPFVTLYMLEELRFSYLELTLATTAFVAAQLASLRAWGRLGDLYGSRVLLIASGAVLPLLPLLWLFAPGMIAVLLLQALGGWSWAGFGLALRNYVYEAVPGGARAAHWASHNLLNALGAAAGALLGGAVHAKVPHALEVAGRALPLGGVAAALVLSALLRALALAVFLPRLDAPRRARPFSARVFFFAMVRFSRAGTFVTGCRRRRRTQAASGDRLDA